MSEPTLLIEKSERIATFTLNHARTLTAEAIARRRADVQARGREQKG